MFLTLNGKSERSSKYDQTIETHQEQIIGINFKFDYSTKRAWNGHNASCWRTDALKVNGFDERMKYGGEDVEFGYRLVNSGLVAANPLSCSMLALGPSQGYVNENDLSSNLAIRKSTLNNRVKFTNYGIIKGHNLGCPDLG